MSDLIVLDNESAETKKKIIQSKTLLERIDEFLMSHQSIGIKQKVIFYRLLSTMVNAGISIMKGIAILQKQEKNPLLIKFYEYVIKSIREGKSLSVAMREYGSTFSDSECSIVESGEKTGKLNSALTQLAEQVEKVASISTKIRGALMYPIAIIIVMCIAVGVLMIAVVPKIVEIFGDKSKLPMSTQLLIGTSDFFVSNWIYMVLGMIGLVIFVALWKKTDSGKYKYDLYMLRLPIFGKLLQKVILSKFSRVFSNLLGSGISIVESLRIVSDIVDNEVYRQRILLLREDVKRGVKIGESLEDDSLFPEMLIQMIKVGEETAKLDTIILKIADFYDEEVDVFINGLQKVIEPVIIVTMAVVVGFIAAGIMQPIMNMSDIISEG